MDLVLPWLAPRPWPTSSAGRRARRRYSPTLLRELLLSESEGMMDKTL